VPQHHAVAEAVEEAQETPVAVPRASPPGRRSGPLFWPHCFQQKAGLPPNGLERRCREREAACVAATLRAIRLWTWKFGSPDCSPAKKNVRLSSRPRRAARSAGRRAKKLVS